MASTPADPPAEAAELAARSAIATNLARHSRGVDRNDLALLASAYHPGATVAYGMFEGAADGFAAFLTGAMAGAPPTLHRSSNMMIRVDGALACSETYVIAYLRAPDEGGGQRQQLIGGRYLDRHACRAGEWRIEHRAYVMDWNLNVPSREPAAQPGMLRGAQGDDDRAAAMFADFRAQATTRERTMTTGSVDDAIARQALHDLVVTYARATDRADEALLASVFHADAEVVTGIVDGRAPDYAREVVALLRGNLRSTFHSVANEYFEIAGEAAAGESYVLAHMMTAGESPEETLIGGRYLDRFERREGRWKIAHRSFVQDWSMSQPATMEETGMYEQLPVRGGYAPDDPSIAFWAAWAAR